MAQILLLEPDIVLSRIYAKALEQVGHKVSSVLVVLELQLPIHNGVEFLYEFRSYAEWQKTPVIVQSFVPPSEFKLTPSLWRGLGIAIYLYKPRASLQQLLNSVQDQLVTITA